MNSSYTAPKARPGEPAVKQFSFRGALVAYLTAVTTLVTLIIMLGWVVSGQFPTAHGYWILWPYALVSSVVVALIGGYLSRSLLLGAIRVGVIGGLSLLAVTAAAAYAWGIFSHAV
jgi:cation transport ATPase